MDSVKSLSQKLDEVVGRQERTLGLLSNVQSTLAVSGSLNRNAQGTNLNKIINYLSIYGYALYYIYFYNIVPVPQSNAEIGRNEIALLVQTNNNIINSVVELRYK